jgi:protein-L-isoaspartate(D-aspartate) O-methyltransferase
MAGELNIEQARFNMIEQQIRPWEVLDQQVLDAVAAVRREEFVPASYQRLAFADIQIPLGHSQVMMEPKLEARMLQSLQIQSGDTALEIGTGSGYVTALLARLASWVTSIELYEDLSTGAQQRLKIAGIENITLNVGDVLKDWTPRAQYDVVAVTGSVPQPTTAFHGCVKAGGRLFLIVGSAPIMEAMLFTRTAENTWSQESLFETMVPPLVGAVRPPSFVF